MLSKLGGAHRDRFPAPQPSERWCYGNNCGEISMRIIEDIELLDWQTAYRLAAVAADLQGDKRRFNRPPRNFYGTNSGSSLFGIMPLILHSPPLLGLKVVNIFPGNSAFRLSTHQGAYQLFCGRTGQPLAVMNANILTGIRTAAMSAIATSRIAPGLTEEIAIIGTGDLARWHVRAFGTIFKPRRIVIAGRNLHAAESIISEVRHEFPDVEICSKSIEQAVQDASVICTVTSSRTPVVRKEWVAPRAHINAIGAFSPDYAELDECLFERAVCFSDDLEAFPEHCGEYLKLVSQGRGRSLGVFGLWEPGLGSPRAGVSIYKSFGTAIQDIVFAAYCAGIDVQDGH